MSYDTFGITQKVLLDYFTASLTMRERIQRVEYTVYADRGKGKLCTKANEWHTESEKVQDIMLTMLKAKAAKALRKKTVDMHPIDRGIHIATVLMAEFGMEGLEKNMQAEAQWWAAVRSAEQGRRANA